MENIYKQAAACAADLISNRENWNKRRLAVDQEGKQVSPTDPAACRWCAYGALIKCAPELWNGSVSNGSASYEKSAIDSFVSQKTGFATLWHLNDHGGHSATVALLRELAETDKL